MAQFKIHPTAMGAKIFGQSMMTYQPGYGETYTIPIYAMNFWQVNGLGGSYGKSRYSPRNRRS